MTFWSKSFAPDSEQAKSLKEKFAEHCDQAADALAAADVLLLVTGAGFSADSGLAIYADVARIKAYQERNLDYSDLCEAHWLNNNPELFYGFWGQCMNDYRLTSPHVGYDIIARWKDDINRRDEGAVAKEIRQLIEEKTYLESETDDDEQNTPFHVTTGAAGSFFSFTSNVDAHFYDKFPAHEIHECHGNIELWQCTDDDCKSGVWRVPVPHTFVVDPQTMLAPPRTKDLINDDKEVSSTKQSSTDKEDGTSAPRIGHVLTKQREDLLSHMPPGSNSGGWFQEEGMNWPQCGHCLKLARPAILMFGDWHWKEDKAQNQRWERWRKSVLDLCNTRQCGGDELPNLKVCVLEIGCGLNVPTCRYIAEGMVESVQAKGGDATFIRVNPDFPLSFLHLNHNTHVIPIMSTGLAALRQIDQAYKTKVSF